MPVWSVVGGADKGGIIVRSAEDLNVKLDARLSTGALVEELEKRQEKIRYRLLSGTGPETGWVTLVVNGKDLLVPAPEGSAAPEPVDPDKLMTAAERCAREVARGPLPWQYVDVGWVTENHSKRAPGMFYGLEFPWNQEMLLEMGPKWLTKAFHAAGTLQLSNAVTEIVSATKHEFGNNGSKTLFEVKYRTPSPDLHTKLFAKFPFDMNSPKQKTDSLAQRVYKQPQDHTEVNFYRIMEDCIPFKTPKFYFGDISNVNTNFVMITQQIPFDDPGGQEPLEPFRIEGPYDKAMDYELRGDASEYYYLLAKKGAIMAALYKKGDLGPESLLDQFDNTGKKRIEDCGFNPNGVSGDQMFKNKLKMGDTFMFETAAKIFPPECANAGFRETWSKMLKTINAYSAEHFAYRHVMFPEFLVFTHQNLNVDNAYFWRDDEGRLDCGIFDWGNIKTWGLGHMFYWWLYTAEWPVLCEHVRKIMDYTIDTYHEHGGPQLDRDRFWKMYIITALEHNSEVVKAVPLLYKMVPKKDFESITSLKDVRIFKSVDGKSTNRVYLHTWSNTAKMLLEWDVTAVMDAWIDEFSQIFSYPRKDVLALHA